MLLGQELKFENRLCNLKLGTFFSAFPGHRPGYNDNLQGALKGQQLLAQGIALGNYGRKPVAL